MIHDILLIFLAWFLSSLWGVIAIPFVMRFTKDRLSDGGWAMLKTVGWLSIGLPVWFLAHMGIAINNKPGIWITFLLLACASVFYWKKSKFRLQSIWQEKQTLIMVEEFLFIFGIFFLSLIRGYSPDINSLEKFMDAGLIISYAKSPTLPIEDMWLAGSTFNYYTFGHFQGAVATQFWSIEPAISYNILLGLLMGLGLQLGFSIVVNLFEPFAVTTEPLAKRIPLLKKLFANSLKSKHSKASTIIVGFIGAYLIVFGGNTQAIWYLLTRCYSKTTQTAVNFSPADEHSEPKVAEACSFVGYWYPNATRFIPRTIHEFPSYSFIVSDLHAHVWNFVHVLLLLNVLLLWGEVLMNLAAKETPVNRKQWLILTVAVGLLMGVFVMTSTWDALVYSLVLSVMSLLLLLTRPQLLWKLVISGIVVVITMLITSSAWWLHFTSISEGSEIAHEHTAFWQLVTLWFAHVTIGILGAILTYRHMRKNTPLSFKHLMIIGLVISGICLIILPEFFYMKDIYTTQPRANTMFKLTYQAFIQLSIVVALCFGIVLSKLLKITSKVLVMLSFVIITTIIISIGIYPYFGYRDYYLGGQATYKGLDGLNWFKQQYPDDYQAYLWLKQISGRPHIIEAVGDSYTTFDRMSAFTGLPTVLGWRVHEWLWRGSYDIPGKRSSEVESIYLKPTTSESSRLLNQYHVQYIVVGTKEKEAYPQLDSEGLKQLGKVVFQQGETFIVERY